MFVFSFKLTKKKIAVTVMAILLLIILAVVLFSRGAGDVSTMSAGGAGVKTNEDRVAFLKQYGWNVQAEPVETREVLIPDELDAVLLEYNELQKKQGMDLENYCGKRVKCYTYLVLNHDDTDSEVHANIVVYRDKVIAGDISSTAMNGFMHGFEREK